ncbi:MAG: penicillin-binding transpeptidase domain-containing protein [Pseudobdellovibrionaceae bacterium]
MIHATIKFYAAINVLLVVTYLFLKSTRYFAESAKIPISYLNLNRVAQILLISSVLAPITLSLLPSESVPNFKIEARAPLPDTLSSERIKKKIQHFSVNSYSRETAQLKTETKDVNLSIIVSIVLSIVICAAVTRSILHLLKLLTLLRKAIPIRQIGKVQVLVSEEITIPFSTLVNGVNVVVPLDAVSNLRNLRLIVRHELHHHRNGDTLWLLVMEIMSCFFYWNPFIHLWKREIAEIQEFACDESLISQMRVSAYEYGQCLVNVAEAAQGSSLMQIGTICMGGSPRGPQQLKSFLRRRIEVFKVHENSRKQRLWGITLGTVGVLTTTVLSYGAQKSLRVDGQQKNNSGIAKFDPQIQKETETILAKYVKKFGAKGGFVLVADPQTGRLLAVANQLATHRKLDKSWALSYEIEPASAMKPLIAATAIEKGVIKSDEKLNCENGTYSYGGRTYHDWKPMGTLTTAESIFQSSNICGIKIGERLGAKALESSLKDFGFGPDGSASEFPEAKPGRYPKASEVPETDYVPLLATGYTSSHSFYATPLEVLQAYAAIANDGKLMKPMDADETADGKILKQAISAESAQKMKSILVGAVKDGTGKPAQSLLYTTAGKTSTAYRPESPEHDSLGGERAMAGFVGFSPVQNPRLVVYVGIIDPTNSWDKNPHGSAHAAPVFKEVIETVLPQMKVAPDNNAFL